MLLIAMHFRLNKHHGSLLQLKDLMIVELLHNNLRGFDTKWDSTLAALAKRPDDDLLENLYLKQIQKCDFLSMPIQLYHAEINHQDKPRSYEKLKRTVKIELTNKTQEYHRNTLDHARGHRGAAAKGGQPPTKPATGDPGKKVGQCFQWKKYGQCV